MLGVNPHKHIRKHMTPTPHPLTTILIGARDTTPLLLAAAPFGMVFGALAVSAGMTPAQTMAMSLFVFAGSSQFIGATLIGAGALAPIIILTTLVVNLRHMLYSISLMPKVESFGQGWRAPMAFWLTDETYATVMLKLDQLDDPKTFRYYYLGSAIAMYGLWQVNTGLGILIGESVPDVTSWGLEVAMAVAFIGVVVPSLKDNAGWACAVTASIGMLLTYQWPNQIGLFVSSLAAIAVGVIIRRRAET